MASVKLIITLEKTLLIGAVSFGVGCSPQHKNADNNNYNLLVNKYGSDQVQTPEGKTFEDWRRDSKAYAEEFEKFNKTYKNSELRNWSLYREGNGLLEIATYGHIFEIDSSDSYLLSDRKGFTDRPVPKFDKKILEKAQEKYLEAIEIEKIRDNKEITHLAYGMIGKIEEIKGNYGGTLAAYRNALNLTPKDNKNQKEFYKTQVEELSKYSPNLNNS